MKSKKQLREQIEKLKSDMIACGDKKGLNHPLTVKISQELDELINEYMKLTQQK